MNNDVRRVAVQELARGWKDDPDTFDILCRCSINHPFNREYSWQDSPRQTALQLLLQHYPTHPKPIEILHDRALNDPDEQLREWAENEVRRKK